MGSLLMLGLMFLIFYFLLIRPQQKRAKEHRQLVDALERGDEVVLQGGVHGTVTGVTEKVLTIEVADGVRIKADRHAVVRKKSGDG
jgi:preprotein translocase subunit YajC